MPFCPKCGIEVLEVHKFCKSCGANLRTDIASIMAVRPKDRGTTLLLAILLGLIGFYGMGQVYVGRVGRGITFLIADWLISILAIICIISFFLWPVGAFLLLLSAGLFFWQIFDANGLVTHYNKVLEETGKAPW